MFPEYTQQTSFLLSNLFFHEGKYHLAHFGTHFMEEETKTKTFLIANASGGLHDAYESAY